MTATIKDLLSVMNTEGKSSDEILEEATEKFPDIMDYFKESTSVAQAEILKSISEEDFVKIARIIFGSVLSIMMAEGKGDGLIYEHTQGDLDGFVHTVVLTMIGVLMSEEVL